MKKQIKYKDLFNDFHKEIKKPTIEMERERMTKELDKVMSKVVDDFKEVVDTFNKEEK